MIKEAFPIVPIVRWRALYSLGARVGRVLGVRVFRVMCRVVYMKV